jgi:hypothetical protein
MTKQFITAITKEAEYLTLTFDQPWFQEDIEELTQQVFATLTPVNIQEKIIGADRENIRFSWQAYYFILNFDCCSQSCWLEGQDNESSDNITLLYLALES